MQKLVWQNANGVELDLTSGNYGITEWEGFSNTGLNIQSQQVPFQDGGVFLDALIEQRELSVTLAIQDRNNLELRYQQRRELISALNPKLGEGYLIYTNDFISKRIKCIPQIPIFETHNSDMSGTPKATLTWTACEPYWEDLEETIVPIEVETNNLQIENEGDLPVGVKVIIEGGATIPTLTNETTGKKIQNLITVNGEVDINTNYGQKEITEKQDNFSLNYYAGKLVKAIYSSLLQQYFIADENGNIWTSTDEIHWEIKNIGNIGTKKVKTFTYSVEMQLFLLMGTEGLLFISKDGKDWEDKSLDSSVTTNCVIYSKSFNMFYSVGDKIRKSTDGINWVEDYAPSYICNSIIELRGVLYVVGNNGLCLWYYQLPSQVEIQWNVISTGTTTNILDIIQIPIIDTDLCIVGEGGLIKTGVENNFTWTWTARTSGVSQNLNSVIATETEMIVAGNNGTVLSSAEGTTWTIKYTNNNFDLINILYVSQIKKILATGTNGVRLFSEDLENWELYAGITETVTSVCYSEKLDLYCLVGFNGYIATSEDGTTWIQRTSGVSFKLRKVKYNNYIEKFIAVGESQNILISEDGINWTTSSTGTQTSFNDFAFYENTIILVSGYFGSNIVRVSTDGMQTWGNVTIQTTTVDAIEYFEKADLFVAVGAGTTGKVYTSEDGTTWNIIPILQSGGGLKAVASNENIVVAIGDYGIVYRSYNGIDWEYVQNNVASTLVGLVYDSYAKLFITFYTKIYISGDGSNLEEVNLNISVLSGGTYSARQNKVVLVGDQIVVVTNPTTKNIIQTLSSDSDMNFNLKQGINDIKISKASGIFAGAITYRQKYIGV